MIEIIGKIKRMIKIGPSTFEPTQFIVQDIAKNLNIKLTDGQIYYIIVKSKQI